MSFKESFWICPSGHLGHRDQLVSRRITPRAKLLITGKLCSMEGCLYSPSYWLPQELEALFRLGGVSAIIPTLKETPHWGPRWRPITSLYTRYTDLSFSYFKAKLHDAIVDMEPMADFGSILNFKVTKNQHGGK